MSTPPPKHAPCTAHTTGLRHRSNEVKLSCSRRMCRYSASASQEGRCEQAPDRYRRTTYLKRKSLYRRAEEEEEKEKEEEEEEEEEGKEEEEEEEEEKEEEETQEIQRRSSTCFSMTSMPCARRTRPRPAPARAARQASPGC